MLVTVKACVGHTNAFEISANSCTGALAPGGTCTVTVRFHPPSNAGDGNYASDLQVAATPGTAAKSSLTGFCC